MQLANQEAQRFNHEYIGTEHMLLGLVKEGSGQAAKFLKLMDVDLRRIRLEVEKMVQSGPEMITMGRLPQTPRAKKVIEYSMEEARNMGSEFVGTEHLLLGLLKEKEGVAADALSKLGVELETTRNMIVQEMGLELVNDSPDRIRLDDQSMQAVRRAHQIAARLGVEEVDTGHLLYSIVSNGSSAAASFLRSAGIQPNNVWDAIKDSDSSSPVSHRRMVSISENCKTVYDVAKAKARERKEPVRPDDLLQGLATSGSDQFRAVEILKNLEVELSQVTKHLDDFVERFNRPPKLLASSTDTTIGKSPFLNRFGHNLTLWAYYNFDWTDDLDQQVIDACMLAMRKRNRNNVILVGDHRTGLHYLHAVAQRLAQAEIDSRYDDVLLRIILPYAGSDVDPEKFIYNIQNEARKIGTVAVALERMNWLFEMKSSSEPNVPLIQQLIRWLSFPSPRFLGILSPDKLDQFEQTPDALNCFEVIKLSDFDTPSLKTLVVQDLQLLEDHHLCVFPDSVVDKAIEVCTNLNGAHDAGSVLIDALDQAAAQSISASSERTLGSDDEDKQAAKVARLDQNLRHLSREINGHREVGRYRKAARLNERFDVLLSRRVKLQPLSEVGWEAVEKAIGEVTDV